MLSARRNAQGDSRIRRVTGAQRNGCVEAAFVNKRPDTNLDQPVLGLPQRPHRCLRAHRSTEPSSAKHLGTHASCRAANATSHREHERPSLSHCQH